MKKSKHKALPISRGNTSRKPSSAKREAEKRAKRAEAARKGKKLKLHEPKIARVKKVPARPFKLSAFKARTPMQLPETELSKKGMTLKGLLRSTPRLMINNAGDVHVRKIALAKTKTGMPAIKATTVTHDPFRRERVVRPHATFIIGLDKDESGNPDVKKPISRHKKILTSCDCENYVFTWEYANAVHGASRIVYGNGEPPVVTNPHLVPGLCKHLVAVAVHIIKQNK